jgi:hypothetical protein
MIRKISVAILLFIMVHGTVFITISQYHEIEMTIEIVEEEETNHSENASKIDNKIQEYTLVQHSNFEISMDNLYYFSKKLDYYKVHIIDLDQKPPLDNPPEA